ncbi:hypothetical protein GW17_00019889 [Ensete ventricosum]|nr:hypothetical protein GW17_00019889 [Ensete ventricosum]
MCCLSRGPSGRLTTTVAVGQRFRSTAKVTEEKEGDDAHTAAFFFSASLFRKHNRQPSGARAKVKKWKDSSLPLLALLHEPCQGCLARQRMFFCCSGSSTSGKWSGVMRDPRTMRSYGSRRTGEVLLRSVEGWRCKISSWKRHKRMPRIGGRETRRKGGPDESWKLLLRSFTCRATAAIPVASGPRQTWWTWSSLPLVVNDNQLIESASILSVVSEERRQEEHKKRMPTTDLKFTRPSIEFN